MQNDDAGLTRVLREWQTPEAPPWLEARVIGRRDAHRRARLVTGIGLAAAVAVVAAASLMVRPSPPRAVAVVTADDAAFVPVPDVLPLDSYETGRVLRMRVPVSALLAVGYSLPADPTALVTADVLVGEDGRAHAVRLVSGMTSNATGD